MANSTLRLLGVVLGLWLLAGYSREADAQTQDLRNTNGGRELLNVLKSLAQGNERSAGVDSLTADLRSGNVNGSVWIRHRQKSAEVGGTAGDLLRRANVSREVIAYDLTMRGKFAFNPKRGTGHLTLDLGRGVKFDTKKVEQLLEGDLSVVADAYPTLGFLEKRLWNDYDTIRRTYDDRYGRGNAYVASKRFVDWATPETAGRWVLTAIATAGTAAVTSAIRESQNMSMKEAAEIGGWLQQKGIRESTAVVRSILSGERVDWPYLAVKWQAVPYYSQNLVAGRPVGPRIPVSHAAFVLVWKSGQGTGTVEPHRPPAASSYAVTFTNDAPYRVDFFLNGSGPLSRPLAVEPRRSVTFNLAVSREFSPYVRIRQPDGSSQDFSLSRHDQRYRFRRTQANRVVNVQE